MIKKSDLLTSQLNQADKAGKAHLLIELLNVAGQQHFEEEVTQYAHAVQSAWWAKQDNARPEMVAAALLHDIGHLLVEEEELSDTHSEADHFHENLAADVLSDYFPPLVTEAIRLHVLAKRYLVSTREAYYHLLSPASKESFHLQGGYMSEEELADFEAKPFFKEALDLRIWDDRAKDTELTVPPAEHYLEDLLATLR